MKQVLYTAAALKNLKTHGNMDDTITMTRQDYQDLVDARDHALAMRDVTAGAMPVLTEAEANEYLDAPSPLVFWRKHRGHTQAALAALLDISQAYLSQIEASRRVGDVNLYVKMARALQVRIEDLIAD